MESKRRERRTTSLLSRLDGSVVGLGLLCPTVPVLDQSILSGAERAKFCSQPSQDQLMYGNSIAMRSTLDGEAGYSSSSFVPLFLKSRDCYFGEFLFCCLGHPFLIVNFEDLSEGPRKVDSRSKCIRRACTSFLASRSAVLNSIR